MGRKRNESILESIFDTLKIAPVWFSPVLAAAVFVFIRWVTPMILAEKPGAIDTLVVVRNLCPTVSWWLAGSVFILWIAAEIHKFGNRKLLDDQVDQSIIQGISWQEFERLVCEAYRRHGYVAQVVGSESGDGGVDVELTRGSELSLVQCKHWKSNKVGVATVRELLGVVVSQGATAGMLITSGSFTPDATSFAAKNPQIELIDGRALFKLIQQVKNDSPRVVPTFPAVQPKTITTPSCPSCGASMVRRLARKGSNAGNEFWGCPKYPVCRGTVNV